ncbi:MAG: carbon-nitrogen hydrolase family protein [Rhodococcus sp. (in: high G+C Gram-positive bacteria)]|nr:carbon-nitrogen hydrolase family protein [Rhodococcus sp. (in: high G+C Gram-positive bacteria)]
MNDWNLNLAVAQFAVGPRWQDNLAQAVGYIEDAERSGVDLLVLPEGILVRFDEHRERIREAAQPLDGPFVTQLRNATQGRQVTVVAGIHETNSDDRPFNTLVVVRNGELVAVYRKIHLYDAFGSLESDRVAAADDPPVVFTCAGATVGLITCYDLRFPEMTRLLASMGAQVLVAAAAWAAGPLKLDHWTTLVRARALDATAYVAAAGECGQRCEGNSLIVDPLGRVLTQLGHEPSVTTAQASSHELNAARAQLPIVAHERFKIAARPDPAAGDKMIVRPEPVST